MKVKELLNSCTGGYFVVTDTDNSRLISNFDTLCTISSTYGVDGLFQILEAEVAEFNIDNYGAHKNALVIKISDSNRILTDSNELDDLLQQGAKSIEEELPDDDAVVLKAALDDFVAAVEKMSTNENSIPELAAAIVVLYAIYKDINRRQ